MNNLSKWIQTIKISWSRYTAYRINFFLQVIGPALVFFFIKYNLWSSIYQGSEDTIIKGYSFSKMINYHVWTLIVGLIAQGHTAMNLSEDIRLGRISTYLIYPFNFWEFHTASFLSFQLLQTLIAIITISIIFLLGILDSINLTYITVGLSFGLFVSFFWYMLQYLTGIISFWLEETWILRVSLMVLSAFLSGAIIPLDLYPEAFVNILEWTPFPYLAYYPVKVFSGEFHHLTKAVPIITAWTLGVMGLNAFIWNKGIKNYTAAGM